MGGGSGDGGGGGFSGWQSGGYDDAPMKSSRRKKQREQEEFRVQLAEQEDRKGYYARGSGGSIVRSSSGDAVTSSAGAKTVDDFRSQEVSELYGSEDRMRDAARMQLENRLINPQLPSIGIGGVATGKIAEANLKRQLDLLASGGKPQFRRTATGRYVTTGVVGAGQGNDSSPNIANTFSSNGDGGSSASTGGTAARSASVSTSGETSRAARRGLFGAAKGVKQRLFY